MSDDELSDDELIAWGERIAREAGDAYAVSTSTLDQAEAVSRDAIRNILRCDQVIERAESVVKIAERKVRLPRRLFIASIVFVTCGTIELAYIIYYAGCPT